MLPPFLSNFPAPALLAGFKLCRKSSRAPGIEQASILTAQLCELRVGAPVKGIGITGKKSSGAARVI